MKSLTSINENESLPIITLPPVLQSNLIDYAEVSKDFNPIHTDKNAALDAGLPGVIAHGMWTMGNLTKLFTPFLEQGFLETFKVRFINMVFLEDILRLQAVLTLKKDKILEFDVYAINQQEEKVVTGTAHFKLYD